MSTWGVSATTSPAWQAGANTKGHPTQDPGQDSSFGSSPRQLGALQPYSGSSQDAPPDLLPEVPGGGSESADEAGGAGDGESFPDCLSLEELQSVYHLPSKEAADHLGVSLSRLKRSCRVHKVVRWPHRKLSSLVNLEETIRNDKNMKPFDKQRILESIARELVLVKANPDHAIDSKLDDIRQAKYKLKYYHKTKHIQAAAAAQARKRRAQAKPASAARSSGSPTNVLPSSSSHWGQTSWGTLSTEVGGVVAPAPEASVPSAPGVSPFAPSQAWAAGSATALQLAPSSRQSSSRYLAAAGSSFGTGDRLLDAQLALDGAPTGVVPGTDWPSLPSVSVFKAHSERTYAHHTAGAGLGTSGASAPLQAQIVTRFTQFDGHSGASGAPMAGSHPFLDELQVVAASAALGCEGDGGSQFTHGVIDTAVIPPGSAEGESEDTFHCGPGAAGEHPVGRRASSFAGNERLSTSGAGFGPAAPTSASLCVSGGAYLPDRTRFHSQPALGASIARRSMNGTVHLPTLNLGQMGLALDLQDYAYAAAAAGGGAQGGAQAAAAYWKEQQAALASGAGYSAMRQSHGGSAITSGHMPLQSAGGSGSGSHVPSSAVGGEYALASQYSDPQQGSQTHMGGGSGPMYGTAAAAAAAAGGVRHSSTNSSPLALVQGVFPSEPPALPANACATGGRMMEDDLPMASVLLGGHQQHHQQQYHMQQQQAELKDAAALTSQGSLQLLAGLGMGMRQGSGGSLPCADMLARLNSGGLGHWRGSAGASGMMPNSVLESMLFGTNDGAGAW